MDDSQVLKSFYRMNKNMLLHHEGPYSPFGVGFVSHVITEKSLKSQKSFKLRRCSLQL